MLQYGLFSPFTIDAKWCMLNENLFSKKKEKLSYFNDSRLIMNNMNLQDTLELGPLNKVTSDIKSTRRKFKHWRRIIYIQLHL